MRYLLIILLSLLCMDADADGDGRFNIPRVHYESLGTSWSGDTLRLTFRVKIEGDVPGSGVFMGIIPHCAQAGGDMPGVGYFRPADMRYYRRRRALDAQTQPQILCEAKVARKGSRTVDYAYDMAVPASFDATELNLETRLFRCHDVLRVSSERVAIAPRASQPRDTVYIREEVPVELPQPIAVVSLPLYESNVTFVKPRSEKIKARTATVVIRITYPVNVSRVLPSFENNGAELQRIDSILRPMATDTSTYRILKTTIVGYASPEDTYIHNLTLSEQRATGMRQWLVDRYGMNRGDITTSGAGEDWTGLRNAIVHSDMDYKDEVLEIIDRYGINNGREKLLMELHAGRPYNYMLEHFFPSLRRMELEMIYTVRPFTPVETDSVLEDRPQDLSQEEIYDVARERNSDQTIQHRRTEYGKEYDVAVRYFPNDAVANINAASAALVRGDLDQARMYLERVADDPLAANNLGVYYWLCGDPDTAEKYFNLAKESDPVRAEHNLEELARWREEQHRGKE